MCFEPDSSPPIPVISGAAVSHEDLVLDGGGRQPVRRVLRAPRGAVGHGRRDPARRPRPLPLLRGARAALRRAGLRRDRDRLLRPHRGRREARRRLRVHAARRQTTARTACRQDVGAGVRHAARARRARRSSPSASASAAATPGSPRRRATACRARSASTGIPGERNGVPGPAAARRRDRGADPRRFRPATTRTSLAENNAAFDAALDGRGRRARARHVRGRAAQLLRPQAGAVRRRLRGCMAAGARVHRAPPLGTAPLGTRGKQRRRADRGRGTAPGVPLHSAGARGAVAQLVRALHS